MKSDDLRQRTFIIRILRIALPKKGKIRPDFRKTLRTEGGKHRRGPLRGMKARRSGQAFGIGKIISPAAVQVDVDEPGRKDLPCAFDHLGPVRHPDVGGPAQGLDPPAGHNQRPVRNLFFRGDDPSMRECADGLSFFVHLRTCFSVYTFNFLTPFPDSSIISGNLSGFHKPCRR